MRIALLSLLFAAGCIRPVDDTPLPGYAEPTPVEPAQPQPAPEPKRRLILFTADWCGPCKAMERGPLAELRKPKTKTDKGEPIQFELQIVDVDKYPAWKARYEVDAVPTLIGTIDGEEHKRHVGALMDTKKILDLIGK